MFYYWFRLKASVFVQFSRCFLCLTCACVVFSCVQKLEKELQELSFMEDKVKHKMQHLKSASTLTSTSASFSNNTQSLQQSSSARKRG